MSSRIFEFTPESGDNRTRTCVETLVGNGVFSLGLQGGDARGFAAAVAAWRGNHPEAKRISLSLLDDGSVSGLPHMMIAVELP